MRFLPRTLLWTLALSLGAVVSQAAAIVVAPTAVYITGSEPGSSVILYNPASQPEEVTVEVRFGYPATDAQGNVRVVLDSTGSDPRSAADWIRVLPRRLVVEPGQRRAVRLLAQPPAGTPDGEYWARLVVTSRGQTLPVAGVPDSSDVDVGLTLQMRTILAVTYRQGEVTTGVEVQDFEPRIQGDSLVVHPNLVRRGGGAYIGRSDILLQDAEGRQLRAWQGQVAVYRDYRRRYAFDVSDLPAGEYRVILRLSTEREDVPPEARLATVPVEVAAGVTR